MISISFKKNLSIFKIGEVQDLNGCMLQNELRYHITMYSLKKKNGSILFEKFKHFYVLI